jgi:prolyl 3-hydroxylase /prolyl 3,4-dihydroxylase
MARTRDRSPDADANQAGHVAKRLKTSHTAQPRTNGASTTTTSKATQDPTSKFANKLFEKDRVAALHESYKTSDPYKYAVVDKLFQDELLRKVKDEIMGQLSFTEKETDIYKVSIVSNR